MKVFAERLKELRLEKELSQRGLAKLLNLSVQAISQWENESRTPNAEAVAVIAKFFGVTSDYLLGLED
ncbi:MAG: helix-turn-helix domain-containing protein [Clostridia bacterium]|nr:helix-turn-helix domain-containing protein [Clostridia bacterium]